MFKSIEEAKKEIHQYAKNKGWYEGRVKSDMESLMLAIGELSEAAEEYRNGSPEFYVIDAFGQDHNVVKDTSSNEWYTKYGTSLRDQNLKPEGFSIEVVDCCIRLLDWAGFKGYDLSEGIPAANEMLIEDFKSIAPVEFCFQMAKKIVDIHGASCGEGRLTTGQQILLLLESCNNYIHSRGYNMMDLIEVKHTYNTTRPNRHGGKVI